MNLAKWEAICLQRGLQPVGFAPHKLGDVYIAERKLPGVVTSADPIESVPHFEIAWAIFRQGGAYGRSIKFRAWEMADRAARTKAAIYDAVQHMVMGDASGRAH